MKILFRFGFEETVLSNKMSVFKTGGLAFYLHDYYAQEWIDNSMIFLEVENVTLFCSSLLALNLPNKYQAVKVVPIKTLEWGKECFIHDPSGVLWHITEFFVN